MLYDSGKPNLSSVNLEEGQGVGGGREETYVRLRLIHVDVWQKPTQYCRAIILQLKVNKIRKEKKEYVLARNSSYRGLKPSTYLDLLLSLFKLVKPTGLCAF